MRPLKALLAAAASALVFSSSALAGPPPVRAAAYIVENGATGEVLASQDSGQRRAIASITKMMTVLVTLEHAKLDALVGRRLASSVEEDQPLTTELFQTAT